MPSGGLLGSVLTNTIGERISSSVLGRGRNQVVMQFPQRPQATLWIWSVDSPSAVYRTVADEEAARLFLPLKFQLCKILTQLLNKINFSGNGDTLTRENEKPLDWWFFFFEWSGGEGMDGEEILGCV